MKVKASKSLKNFWKKGKTLDVKQKKHPQNKSTN